ncbi:Fanconi anemia group G protein isoform X2 [Parambassis ranga]|uniref:Fanconi anemia group G protein isoform X2 n=1 Tax=Parambassis ranga TaxID=210632 RepID=A0A6P7IY36_9TELE|nr:Fanconi anemia group G protein isoform X2 [Parambassis ranga]
MYQPLSLLDRWIQENNELVNKCKERGRDSSNQDSNQTHLRCCSSEFHKLLRKIQGIPPTADREQLELAVAYNACVCSVAQSQFSEAELLLTQATERVKEMAGGDPGTSDSLILWRFALRSVENKALHPWVLNLLCLQWAIWLATCQLKTIQEFQELSSLCDVLCGGVGNGSRNNTGGIPLLVMDPMRLTELLQICTSITQGAESLSEGWSSEALFSLQAASILPAPRDLVAYTHFLSGCCLTHMSRPQMALQCYKQALETDSCCVSALYQSLLIYKQLGNTQAEIQALRLLYSTLMLPSAIEPALAETHLLSPSLLLSSQSLRSLLSVPSVLSVLHSLALKCVLYGRVSEGVEHFLDLLATIHSEDQHVHGEVPSLPKLPELYLEASAALLMARRSADCMVLCSEVINKTLELLPEKVVLEEPEESSGDVSVEGDSKLEMLLWAAAAYLLQGHCYSQLKDWKQAVTQYTRCINLLIRVRFTKRCSTQIHIPSADMDVKGGKDVYILQRLKGLSLAGRGISFSQIDQLKNALRDLQLSLQAIPECEGAGLWCGEVLWKLGRSQEAAACWERTWSLTTKPLTESLPVYLQESQSGPLLDSTELRHRVQELGRT